MNGNLFFLLLIQGATLSAVTSSDVVFTRMTQESINATRDLERTIALRPVIHTHYHHDKSTNNTYHNSTNNGDITVTQIWPLPSQPSRGSSVSPQPPAKKTWWQSIKQFCYPTKNSLSGESMLNKRELAYKTMLIGYAFVNFRLFRLSLYLQDADRWYFWRQELALPGLLALPQHEMALSLVEHIRQRYGSETENRDTAHAFSSFLKALDEEAAMLNSYQTMSKILLKVDDLEHRCLTVCCDQMPKFWGFSLSYFMTFLASKIRVKTLFYLDDSLLEAIPERLSRLAYMKTIFSHWLAERKILTAQRVLGKDVRALRASLRVLF